MTYKKKLIVVSIPLDIINDDPSSNPELCRKYLKAKLKKENSEVVSATTQLKLLPLNTIPFRVQNLINKRINTR